MDFSAQDKALLASCRARLAATRTECALFDTARFTRNLESAWRIMMEKARAGLSPSGFAVTP